MQRLGGVARRVSMLSGRERVKLSTLLRFVPGSRRDARLTPVPRRDMKRRDCRDRQRVLCGVLCRLEKGMDSLEHRVGSLEGRLSRTHKLGNTRKFSRSRPVSGDVVPTGCPVSIAPSHASSVVRSRSRVLGSRSSLVRSQPRTRRMRTRRVGSFSGRRVDRGRSLGLGGLNERVVRGTLREGGNGEGGTTSRLKVSSHALCQEVGGCKLKGSW